MAVTDLISRTIPELWLNRINLGVRELATRQATERFEVFRRRFFDNILRQVRRWWSLVPIQRLQIIAYELFIEARRALADRVFIFRPEARRIGGQTLVDQKQFSIDRAELEFRVRDDDSLLRRILAAARIDFETQRFHTIGKFIAENPGTLFHVDVLVMTLLCFRRRREDWLR
jgi:hypothetical protein